MMMTRDGVAGDRGCDMHSSGDKGRSLSWAGSQVALQSRAAMSVVVCRRLVENQMRGLETESEVGHQWNMDKKSGTKLLHLDVACIYRCSSLTRTSILCKITGGITW